MTNYMNPKSPASGYKKANKTLKIRRPLEEVKRFKETPDKLIDYTNVISQDQFSINYTNFDFESMKRKFKQNSNVIKLKGFCETPNIDHVSLFQFPSKHTKDNKENSIGSQHCRTPPTKTNLTLVPSKRKLLLSHNNVTKKIKSDFNLPKLSTKSHGQTLVNYNLANKENDDKEGIKRNSPSLSPILGQSLQSYQLNSPLKGKLGLIVSSFPNQKTPNNSIDINKVLSSSKSNQINIGNSMETFKESCSPILGSTNRLEIKPLMEFQNVTNQTISGIKQLENCQQIPLSTQLNLKEKDTFLSNNSSTNHHIMVVSQELCSNVLDSYRHLKTSPIHKSLCSTACDDLKKPVKPCTKMLCDSVKNQCHNSNSLLVNDQDFSLNLDSPVLNSSEFEMQFKQKDNKYFMESSKKSSEKITSEQGRSMSPVLNSSVIIEECKSKLNNSDQSKIVTYSLSTIYHQQMTNTFLEKNIAKEERHISRKSLEISSKTNQCLELSQNCSQTLSPILDSNHLTKMHYILPNMANKGPNSKQIRISEIVTLPPMNENTSSVGIDSCSPILNSTKKMKTFDTKRGNTDKVCCNSSINQNQHFPHAVPKLHFSTRETDIPNQCETNKTESFVDSKYIKSDRSQQENLIHKSETDGLHCTFKDNSPSTYDCKKDKNKSTMITSVVIENNNEGKTDFKLVDRKNCDLVQNINSPDASTQGSPILMTKFSHLCSTNHSNIQFPIEKDPENSLTTSNNKLSGNNNHIRRNLEPMFSRFDKNLISPLFNDRHINKETSPASPSFNSELDIRKFPIPLSHLVVQSPEDELGTYSVYKSDSQKVDEINNQISRTENDVWPEHSGFDKCALATRQSVKSNLILKRSNIKSSVKKRLLFENKLCLDEQCLNSLEQAELSSDNCERPEISGIELLPSPRCKQNDSDKKEIIDFMSKTTVFSEDQYDYRNDLSVSNIGVNSIFAEREDIIEDFDDHSSSDSDLCSSAAHVKKNLLHSFETNEFCQAQQPITKELDQNKEFNFESNCNLKTVSLDVDSDESDNEAGANIEEDFTQETLKSQKFEIECSSSPYEKSFQVTETETEGFPVSPSFPPPLNVKENNPTLPNILDSAEKTNKLRLKKGSLVERLHRLVRAERAEVNMFHHEGVPQRSVRICSLLVHSVAKAFSRVLLSCRYTNAYQPCSEEFSAGEEVVNPEVRVFIDPDFVKDVISGSTVIIYPPWYSLWMDGQGVMVMYRVTKVQVLGNGRPPDPPIRSPPLPIATLLAEYRCNTQDEECGCREELMKQLFGEVQVASTHHHWPEGSVMAALAAGHAPNNTRLTLTVLHRFTIRSPNGGEAISLLCLDNNSHVCQINLRSVDDMTKLDVLMKDSNSDSFTLNRLAICKRISIDRTRSLRSMITVLHPESAAQNVMYVAALTSEQWKAEVVHTGTPVSRTYHLPQIALSQDNIGARRVSGRVCVIAQRGDLLYVWDSTSDSYLKVCVTSSAVLPKFSARTTLDISFLQAHEGTLTIDKYSVVRVVEEESADIQFPLSPLSLDATEGDLVLLDNVF